MGPGYKPSRKLTAGRQTASSTTREWFTAKAAQATGGFALIDGCAKALDDDFNQLLGWLCRTGTGFDRRGREQQGLGDQMRANFFGEPGKESIGQ